MKECLRKPHIIIKMEFNFLKIILNCIFLTQICLIKMQWIFIFYIRWWIEFLLICQRIDSSVYYISSTAECVENCHRGENFICKNFYDENEERI
jgi:hypothetical protein